MAEEFLKPDDDANLRGGNSAPATGASNVNVSTPGSVDSNGQRQSRIGPGSNPLGTSLRRWNPLSKLSSYTYGLTLYLLSPEALNYFANNGTLPPTKADGLYVIVAQSAGINNASEPRGLTNDPSAEPGPGKEGLDYYIDDLTFETILVAQDNQKTATLNAFFSFKVIEPIGFTFLTRLRNASVYVNKNSGIIQQTGGDALPNLYQQHYMVGVKFYGYDADGRMLESSQVEDGQYSRSLNDKFALYERLFPLSGNKVTFAVGGSRATTYNWECSIQPIQSAFGSKHGDMSGNANLQGGTVGEILGAADVKNNKSLVGWLNEVQDDRVKRENQRKPNVYNIIYRDQEAQKIKNSKIVQTAVDNATAPMTPITNKEQSNVKTAEKAVTIDKTSQTINIPAGMSIASVIDQIIVRSEYIADTLKKRTDEQIQAITVDNPKGKLSWYSVKPIVQVLGRDDITKDWYYKIDYEIGSYEVPYLKSQYVAERSKYYGPIKKYDFTFTGENTEVISFEIQYNNNYYVPQPSTTTKDESAATNLNPKSTTPRHASPSVASNPTAGKLNSGSLIVDSVRANLYSVADQSLASIKIMGDPDFLMDSIGHKIQSETFSKFYGSNDSINPYNGQVFIEIIFKVAEDYKENGLMDVDPNQTIAFYPIEEQNAIGNSGLIYYITKVTNTFNRGRFEQTLDLIAVPTTELRMPTREESQASFREAERKYRQQEEEESYLRENPRAALRRYDNELESRQQPAGTSTSAGKGQASSGTAGPKTESADDDANTNSTVWGP